MDIFKSRAFEQFVSERVSEIVMCDHESRMLDGKILLIQKKFQDILSKEQYALFMEYEELCNTQSSHEETLLYRQGLIDAKQL